MKSLLFLSLAAFAVSNGNDGSFYQNPGTYFLFSGIGFAIGAVLGFFFARMPNFDYEEVKVSLKTLLPCMLIWGIIIAGIGYGRISSYYALYLPAIAFSRCVYYSMRFVAISGYFGVVAEFCILPLPFLLQRSKIPFCQTKRDFYFI